MTTSRPTASSSGFWRLALSLCATLALAAFGLGVASAVRPPDLTGAAIAVDRAVTASGERLVLDGRQPLLDVRAEQVEITPAAPFEVVTRDSRVTIRFTGPLAYGTDYTVTVRGVTSRHTGLVSDWTHAFSTPGYGIYSLVSRGPLQFGAEDRVTRTDPTTGETVTILAGTGIEAFTVVAGTVVAVSRASDLETTLIGTVGPEADVMTLETPPGTDLGLLAGSADQGLVGYTVTGQDTEGERFYDNALFLQDLRNPALPPHEVTGAEGRPLLVVDWAFIPGTRSLVVRDDTGQVYLAGAEAGSGLAPLGSHDQLLGFLPGTTTLVVLSGTEEAMLDLASGTTTPLPPPGDAGNTDVLAGQRTMISTDAWIQQFDDLTLVEDGALITSRLVHTRGRAEATIATVPPDLGRLIDSGVSANGQYAWAEILTPDAPPEDLTSGATDNSVTVVIDLATGESLVALPGADALWVTG